MLPFAGVEGPGLVVLFDPLLQALSVAVRGRDGQLSRWVYEFSSWT